MRRTITMTATALLTVVLGFLAHASAAENGRPLVVQLKGKAVGETRSIPPIEATRTTSEGNCFEVDLSDVMTDKVIGTAMRCFTDIKTIGDGMTLTDTTFYRLREGTIVSRERTMIQPAIDGSLPDVTHIAMALAAPFANTVLADAGSGAFKGVPGSTRLAGAMDMRQFRERNEIAFNDIALIKLADRPVVSRGPLGEPGDQQARVRQVQRRLLEAGFAPGDIDGVLGPQTRTALRQYQAKHGLPKTGDLDEATLRALKVS
jgi:hypothetical protein